MKKIIIGLLILISFGYLFAKDKNISANLTFGQTTNDQHKSLAFGLNIEFALTDHMFFQAGYNFMPDYFKQFSEYEQSHAGIFKFYGGYQFKLSQKMSMGLKVGFTWYNIQGYEHNEFGGYYGLDITGVNISGGIRFKHIVSNNISFIWGVENINTNMVAFTGISLNL